MRIEIILSITSLYNVKFSVRSLLTNKNNFIIVVFNVNVVNTVTEIGEYVVGAYLSLIENCDAVVYNFKLPGEGKKVRMS